MMTCLPHDILTSTCAPRGIGKEPIGAFRLTVSFEPAQADPLGEARPVGDGDPVGEGDLAGEDAVWLVAGEADVAGPALVIPAVQAVADRSGAQVTAMAMRRCMFIGWPFRQPGGCRFETADLKLEEHLAVRVAVLSRICDSGRGFGTARHRVPLSAAEPSGITRHEFGHHRHGIHAGQRRCVVSGADKVIRRSTGDHVALAGSCAVYPYGDMAPDDIVAIIAAFGDPARVVHAERTSILPAAGCA